MTTNRMNANAGGAESYVPPPRAPLPETVIDESLLPPPQAVPVDERRGIRQGLSYEAWAWFQAMFYWIPGRLGWLIRRIAYRPFFRRAGKGWHIAEFASIQRVSNFQIGHKVAVGRYCIVNAMGGVIMADFSGIGPYTQLLSATHNFRKIADTGLDYGMQSRIMETAPVIIEQSSWLGAGCVVLPGVRIGPYSVVAAGSTVHKDVPPYTVVGGVPARTIWRASEEIFENVEGEYVLTSVVARIKNKGK